MRIRRALVGCTVGLLAGSWLVTGGVANAEPLTCSSEPRTVTPVDLGYQDQWTYTFALSWCVEDGKIVWAVPEVTHVEHGTTCTWAGRREEALVKSNGEWKAFDMSEYSCASGDGSPRGVNPWVEVVFHPNGEYAVRKGVEE